VYIYEYYAQPIFYILVRLVAEQLPGKSWSQYIDNYRMIYNAVLSGSTYAAMAATINHVQWAIFLVEQKTE
jgi:DNA-binding GntR family transcriptional regulator